ncbi:hypothetical protein [Bradyrhizobium sp. AZCC 1678]|uniref:hypothetical protein n=1 Tax=Bradyrhizobium sp. AZCC 1678 TaxID=3117030 RepID=UPI002FEEEDB8
MTEALQPGERVLWQSPPDGVARMMMWRFLWWIGFPWLLLTLMAISRAWIDQSIPFLLMPGVMMVAAPFVMLLHDQQTLFAITNRRALIVRTAWGKRTVTTTRFEDMDAAFEIADMGRGAGHLNFASGRSTRSPDTDHTGRYGFRCVRNPSGVRDIRECARRRTV